MSREIRAPFENSVWFKEGKPTREAYDFLSQLSDNNAIINQGFFNYKQSFADLAAINDAIPNPDNWLSIMTDQGQAVYNPSSGWVLASDNTTAIT